MKKSENSGFTLVELLAVMVLLGLVMTLALPIYGSVYNTIKNTTYTNKIKTVRMAALDYSANSYVKDLVKQAYHKNKTDGDWCRTVYVADLIRAGYIQSDDKYKDFITDLYTGGSLGHNSLTYNTEDPEDTEGLISGSTVSLCYCMDSLSVDAYLTKDLALDQEYHKGETVRYIEDGDYYSFRVVSEDFIYNEILTKVRNALKNNESSITYEGKSINLAESFDFTITDYSESNPQFIKGLNLLIKKNFLSKLTECNH